jgi:hypothetical protein
MGTTSIGSLAPYFSKSVRVNRTGNPRVKIDGGFGDHFNLEIYTGKRHKADIGGMVNIFRLIRFKFG